MKHMGIPRHFLGNNARKVPLNTILLPPLSPQSSTNVEIIGKLVNKTKPSNVNGEMVSQTQQQQQQPQRSIPIENHLKENARIAQLEQNIKFLQEQHELMLNGLHREIETLKYRNRELQFQLVFVKGSLPSSPSSPEDDSKSKVYNSPKPLNVTPIQIEILEKELNELKLQLQETDDRNVYLSAIVDEQKKKLERYEREREKERASAQQQQQQQQQQSNPELLRKLDDAEAIIRRLRRENSDLRREQNNLGGYQQTPRSATSNQGRNGRHRGNNYRGSGGGGGNGSGGGGQSGWFPPLHTQNYWQNSRSSNNHQNHHQNDSTTNSLPSLGIDGEGCGSNSVQYHGGGGGGRRQINNNHYHNNGSDGKKQYNRGGYNKGILTDLQESFDIKDNLGGLLQTAFVLSYMIFAPLFGYLGDRYSRKIIMAFGVFLWSLTTLAGSFMTDYWWFLFFRALVGIGEASYSTIAPTIISDLFVSDLRSKMLALFYFAIPVGSGLGYIVGAETAHLAGEWNWALRVTPVLGVIAVLLIIFFVKDPVRGQSECTGHMEATAWVEDIKDIIKNRSFMFSTAGFTCVAFVAGALAWWGPKFIEMGIKLQTDNETDSQSVSYKFGIISMLSGLIGVPCGSMLAQHYRKQWPNIDPYICGIGLLCSSPLVYLSCIVAQHNTALCFTFIFFAEFFLNLTWSIVADIILYVVLPMRRSTAQGLQLLASHALGDAGSPYLIGVLSDALNYAFGTTDDDTQDNKWKKFHALQYALFSTCFVEVVGGLFFLITALYILNDKHKVDKAVQDARDRNETAEQEYLA